MKADKWRLIVLWTGLLLYAVLMLRVAWGGAMRESDQASLLDGSFQLARDGDLLGRSFYNYDRQFGSYWVLGAAFKILGLGVNGVEPESILRVGNLVSALVFLCPFILLCRKWKPGWLELAVLVTVFLSPVLLFSAPMLSSNFISAGCLSMLVGCLLRKPCSWPMLLFTFAVSFAAVACRADAVLVMPWLAFLTVDKLSWRGFIGNRGLWAAASGGIAALVLGPLVSNFQAASYNAFFEGKVFAAYLVFGLGATLLPFLFLAGGLLKGSRERAFWMLFGLAALALPLIFYGRILFTPRHLTATALVVVYSLFFERGRSLMAGIIGGKMRTVAIGVLLFATFGGMVAGIRLDSLKSGKLVASEPTLYPTTDGYWPMGCHGQFVSWLAHASERPVDHNQRVWQAWTELESVPPNADAGMDTVVLSEGLVSLGILRLRLLGFNALQPGAGSEFPRCFTDSRSLFRANAGISVDRNRQRSSRTWPDKGTLVASGKWSEIYFCHEDGEVGENAGWTNRVLVAKFAGGEDFVWGRKDSAWNELRGGGPFRWLTAVVANDEMRDPWKRLGEWNGMVLYECVSEVAPPESGSWMARSALASFIINENR